MRDRKRKIELPDLAGRNKIIPDNLRAVQAIYVAAMLEELRLFQVVSTWVVIVNESQRWKQFVQVLERIAATFD